MAARFWIAALFVAAAPLPGITVDVAPNSKVPSLAVARDLLRARRHEGAAPPFVIRVHGGIYRLGETLVLGPEDSGILIENAPGERPIVSGGRRIEGWGVSPSGPLLTARLSGNIRQLFVAGRRAQRARTPNHGFYRIDGASSENKPFLLRFRGGEIKREWAGSGAEAVALLLWAELRMPIVAIDGATHTATLAGNPPPYNREENARFWIENSPDALDEPGEWYLDRQAGVLYYWPVPGDNLTRDEAVAPALTTLVRIHGARDIVLRGLDFRHADWDMPAAGYAGAQAAVEAPSAIDAIGAENVAIEHCLFSQMGGYAVRFGRGSRRNRITANHIFDMGAGGIRIGETDPGVAEADRNFGNIVSDNDLHHLGLVYPSAVGIWVGQSGQNTIAHNHVHNLFYTAVSVGWTWGYGASQSQENVVEFNHLHHVGRGMMSDLGAIYTLGVQPGTAIRNNLIHDVDSFKYGGWGVYLDEGSSGIKVENNVVYRTKDGGFHQHYGRDNIVRNNVFAFGHEWQLMRTRAESHVAFTFEKNIIYWDTGRLLGSDWSGTGFRIDRNLYWDARGEAITFANRTLEEWRAQGHDANSVIADPRFVDPGAYDFELRRGSPALRLGFAPINLRRVGPRGPAGLPIGVR
jgi:parallel beta-helix repeat protein